MDKGHLIFLTELRGELSRLLGSEPLVEQFLGPDGWQDAERLATRVTQDFHSSSFSPNGEQLHSALTHGAHLLAREVFNQVQAGAKSPDVTNLWGSIIKQYHLNDRSKFIGISSSTPKKEEKNEEASPQRELLSYIFVTIQALIVMKAVVLYFGLQSANEQSQQSQNALLLAIGVSFFSLIFFAWRKSRSTRKDT